MTMISHRLAAWAAGLTLEALPEAARQATKLRILDILGAMLAGSETTLAARVLAAVAENGEGGTTLVGSAARAPLGLAALVNGTTAHVLEYDDSHVETGVHPTSPVLAAALGQAEALHRSGRDLLLAVALGNEVACRLACVAPGMFHRHGFHPTGVFGIFGAVAALASLQRQPAAVHGSALGLAGSMSAALMAAWEDGSESKSLHAGLAAQDALQALALARHGVSGPGVVFEGRFGFFPAHVQAPGYAFRWEAATAALGERWELLSIAAKVYPNGHYIQPFTDAAETLQRRHHLRAEEIAAVECAVADYMVPLVCEPVAEKAHPNTPWHARFSLQHSIAELLVTGRLDKRSYTEATLADPRIAALRARINHRVDEYATDRRRWSGDVTIRTTDGRVLHHRVVDMRGTPANPLGTEDIVAKFTANAAGVIPDAAAARCIETVLGLERLADTAALLALLRP
ncbi:MmgE/PrpD family protein [Siccirubricoccus phaeus]|uniref:MmgE/PrpD family protein n=1 Tax=Siccirubricoccus phaeus TaxID=2595053 RepID=UPI0011F0ECA9|nr:MmgE/PrpD family protein [Siccirubricoccus phaeus]